MTQHLTIWATVVRGTTAVPGKNVAILFDTNELERQERGSDSSSLRKPVSSKKENAANINKQVI